MFQELRATQETLGTDLMYLLKTISLLEHRL